MIFGISLSSWAFGFIMVMFFYVIVMGTYVWSLNDKVHAIENDTKYLVKIMERYFVNPEIENAQKILQKGLQEQYITEIKKEEEV